MNPVTEKFLKTLANWKGRFTGAYSLREDGCCVEACSTAFVQITPKKDLPGLDIHILPGSQGEVVAVPACVTTGGLDDLAYNDFFISAGAQATILTGCGLHTEDGPPASHSGIHRFFLGAGAKIRYLEKHLGDGGAALRSMGPEAHLQLGEGAQMEMDVAQLGGIDRARRTTQAVLAAGARLTVRESLLTDGAQQARSAFTVLLKGQGASVDLVSRSVARGESRQSYRSQITGSAPCAGRSACDALITGHAQVDAAPALCASHPDAALVHEAAIGRIASQQIYKLRTLGLTQAQAEEEIIKGFLSAPL